LERQTPKPKITIPSSARPSRESHSTSGFQTPVGLIHAPAPSRWALVFAKDLFKQWQKSDHPAVDRRMVDKHASLLHHFLKMAIAQWIRRVPTDAHQNHVDWESHSFGAQHLVSTLFSQSPQHSRAGCLTVNATKPIKASAASSAACTGSANRLDVPTINRANKRENKRRFMV
jgi:hypothetical protein